MSRKRKTIDPVEIKENFNDKLKNILYKQIMEFKGISYINPEHKKYLVDLMKHAVFDYDSNSALIIGPPSSGKVTLIKSALEELNCNPKFKKEAIIVRLNGIIHTDDKLSLNAISKQMNLKNVVDDKVTGTFADNLTLLLNTFKEQDLQHGIIFILEKFDLFCFHHNQTLIYNLFDITHTNKAAVCVIGITNRMDISDLMEKRVRSRFSHRTLLVNNREGFEERINLSKKLLTLNKKTIDLDASFVDEWNNSVNALFKSGEPSYIILKRIFDVDTREQAIKDFMTLLILNLKENNKFIKPEDFNVIFNDLYGDDRLKSSFTVEEMILIIAMKQLNAIYQGEPINFEMVYRRVQNFQKNHSKLEALNRESIYKFYERLQTMEIIIPVKGAPGSSKMKREYRLYNFQFSPNQVSELIKQQEARKEIPTEVVAWAKVQVV